MAAIPPIQPYPLPTAADLPVNVATWQVDPRRAVLLVHDMQNYFLAALPAGPGIRAELVANVHRLIQTSRELGLPVAYTAQPGDMTPEQRGLLKDFWGPGMRADTADRGIVEPLSPAADDWMFTKWRYSAFVRTDLLARMREHGRDQLVVCGVYAHVGILATVLDGFNHDLQTFIVADAVADFSYEHHRRALEYAAQRCSAVLTTTQLQERLVHPSLAGGRSGT